MTVASEPKGEAPTKPIQVKRTCFWFIELRRGTLLALTLNFILEALVIAYGAVVLLRSQQSTYDYQVGIALVAIHSFGCLGTIFGWYQCLRRSVTGTRRFMWMLVLLEIGHLFLVWSVKSVPAFMAYFAWYQILAFSCFQYSRALSQDFDRLLNSQEKVLPA
jgi:hypothetical protein